MYGERDEPWRAMRRLGQRLELAAEPDRAFPAIVETVADALRLPYVRLEVTDEAGGLVEAAARGPTPADGHRSPLVARRGTGRPAGRSACEPASAGSAWTSSGSSTTWRARPARASGRMRLRDDLARSRERLVLAREEERRRLRRDLHDGLGPSLAAIGMRAEASAAVLTRIPSAARRQLDALGDGGPRGARRRPPARRRPAAARARRARASPARSAQQAAAPGSRRGTATARSDGDPRRVRARRRCPSCRPRSRSRPTGSPSRP